LGRTLSFAGAEQMDVGDLHPASLPLRERLAESPVIGWLKDMEGRYVYANRCYVEQLGASEDRLLGRTDAELPVREAIDGPRLRDRGSIADEPIQLEYRVPACEGRPEFTVMRFPIRDESGTVVGVCGVAGPISDRSVPKVCYELMALRSAAPSVPALSQVREADALLEAVFAPVQAMPCEPSSPLAELAALRRELNAAQARVADLERDLCDELAAVSR
jgi:PAS domain S-box-containing protein